MKWNELYLGLAIQNREYHLFSRILKSVATGESLDCFELITAFHDGVPYSSSYNRVNLSILSIEAVPRGSVKFVVRINHDKLPPGLKPGTYTLTCSTFARYHVLASLPEEIFEDGEVPKDHIPDSRQI